MVYQVLDYVLLPCLSVYYVSQASLTHMIFLPQPAKW